MTNADNLTYPPAENMTLREKLLFVMQNTPMVDALEDIIGVIHTELVRTPAAFPDFKGNAMERDAFYAGVGSMRERLIAALDKDPGDD